MSEELKLEPWLTWQRNCRRLSLIDASGDLGPASLLKNRREVLFCAGTSNDCFQKVWNDTFLSLILYKGQCTECKEQVLFSHTFAGLNLNSALTHCGF